MYKVTVGKNFKYNQRVRAGVVVSREYGYVGELTDEQLSVIEADEQLFVEEIKGDEPAAEEPSNEISQDTEAEALPEADDAELVSETPLDEAQQDVETEDSSESSEQDEQEEAPKDGVPVEKSGKKNRAKKGAAVEIISQ